MHFFAPVLLSFVASALAYTVTVPSGTDGWSASGPQTLSWNRVSTDPATFAVVLTNTDGQYEQVLDAQVNGDLQTISVNPPSGGWPQGQGFRVNLVQDVNHVNTILAQSSEYSIGDTTGSSTPVVTHTTPATATALTTPINSVSAFPATATGTPVTGTAATLAASSSAGVSHSVTSSAPTSSTTTTRNSGVKSVTAAHAGLVPFVVAFYYLFL